jgi:hypothetical protein
MRRQTSGAFGGNAHFINLPDVAAWYYANRGNSRKAVRFGFQLRPGQPALPTIGCSLCTKGGLIVA